MEFALGVEEAIGCKDVDMGLEELGVAKGLEGGNDEGVAQGDCVHCAVDIRHNASTYPDISIYAPVIKRSPIEDELRATALNRILVIDGAMGTTIREYKAKGSLNEAVARGERFKNNQKDLLNNGDILSITKPEIIEDIHRRFLEAGADIIEMKTFGATSIAQSDLFIEDPSIILEMTWKTPILKTEE